MAKTDTTNDTPDVPWALTDSVQPALDAAVEVPAPPAPLVETAPLDLNAEIINASIPDVSSDVMPTGETVTVTVPNTFDLTIDPATTISVKPGIQEMLREHAEHWYAVANGVEIYIAEKIKAIL